MTAPVPAVPRQAITAALATGALDDPFLSNPTKAKLLLEAAAPHLAAAEREQCAQLAEQQFATYPVPWNDGERHPLGETKRAPFAALLREQP